MKSLSNLKLWSKPLLATATAAVAQTDIHLIRYFKGMFKVVITNRPPNVLIHCNYRVQIVIVDHIVRRPQVLGEHISLLK